jgi:Tol biopolymer transport system component
LNQEERSVLSVFLLLIGIVGWTADAGAQPPPPPFFQSLVWSPDGAKIAFCAVLETWDEGFSIYVVNADGSDLRRLTEPGFRALYPAWSPDGTKIAFGGKRNGDSEIFTMKTDGSELHAITDNDIDDLAPSWSPDGTLLTFYSNPEGTYEIFAMRADGSERRQLTHNDVDDWNPTWSPTGNAIVFYSRREGDASDEIILISPQGPPEKALGVRGVFPTWSHDGKEIVFGSTRDDARGVFAVGADGTGLRLLVSGAFYGAWSPDGSQLAVINQTQGELGRKHTFIEIRDRLGSNPRKLLP